MDEVIQWALIWVSIVSGIISMLGISNIWRELARRKERQRLTQLEEKIKKCQEDLVKLVSILAHFATKTDVKEEVIRVFRANADA